jgi:branched-chain amino acid transport system ATP-binding protein
MTLLRTENLTRRFGGLLAVDAVNLEQKPGEVHALIGPNGAGKSTFVGMVAGRIPETSGSVWFEDANITNLPAHRRIQLGMAYTFQITSVYGRLSVFDNVALALGERDASRVREALDRVGLVDRAGHIAGDLSYGHQRLLEIAMGVAQAPKLLILDEPTQGLAEVEIDGFRTIIQNLRDVSSILLIEHNMSVVMALADRITVLNQGAVLAQGNPETVRSDDAVQAAYLGTG